MKKVLIVIGKLKVGGAERIGRDIGYYADKSRYAIHYLVYEDEIGDYEKELTDRGCVIHHMQPPIYGYRKYYSDLMALIKKEKYDVIHSHTMFSSFWVLHAGRKCGVPIRIAHSHTIRGPEKRPAVKRIYESVMRMLVCMESTRYVGCGKSAGIWLFGKRAFLKKGLIIYNGIDLSGYKYDEETRRRMRGQLGIDDCFVIGHVGHLAPVKNQSLLLRLMPQILERKKNARLILLGDGPDREKLHRETEELGIEDKVIFTGNVTGVGDYMNAMDVYAFPSFYEGMPLALVEAQANGLPCVISAAIPDDVYLTELIHPVSLDETDEAWVSQILEVQRMEPERYEKIIRDTGFDIKDMLKKVYALYEGY